MPCESCLSIAYEFGAADMYEAEAFCLTTGYHVAHQCLDELFCPCQCTMTKNEFKRSWKNRADKVV